MCSMNEMCFLVFAWLELVRHVAELAKWVICVTYCMGWPLSCYLHPMISLIPYYSLNNGILMYRDGFGAGWVIPAPIPIFKSHTHTHTHRILDGCTHTHTHRVFWVYGFYSSIYRVRKMSSIFNPYLHTRYIWLAISSNATKIHVG